MKKIVENLIRYGQNELKRVEAFINSGSVPTVQEVIDNAKRIEL